MRKFIILILIMIPLLVGCVNNSAEVERLNQENAYLQSQVAQLENKIMQIENQPGQPDTKRDNRKAMAKFAEQALGLQRVFWDARWNWIGWDGLNQIEKMPWSPTYKIPDKEREAAVRADKLRNQVEIAINAIEQLYAPPEAIKFKKRLLSEGDSLHRALVNIVLYYGNAPRDELTRNFRWGQDFIQNGYWEPSNELKRELTDLFLEYSQ